MKSTPLFLRLLPLLLALLCGCHEFQKPKYDVEDNRILLVPFRDLSVRYGHGYGESKRGATAARYFRRWSETNLNPDFASPGDTRAVVEQLLEWPKTRITSKDWILLLRGIETDLVLVGEIRALRTRDPKTIGLLEGTAKVNYSLIDAIEGTEVYSSGEITIRYPRTQPLDIPPIEFDVSEETIERGLLRLFGERIGKDLFGYFASEW